MYAQVKKFDRFLHQVISLISAFSVEVLRKFGKFLTFLLIFMDNFFKEISKLSAKEN
jgi:hypothetical protein